MSERWQRELKKLHRERLPSNLWQEIESRTGYPRPDEVGSRLSRFGVALVGTLLGASSIAIVIWAFMGRGDRQEVAGVGQPVGGKIAFSSLQDRPTGYFEVYSINADGTGLRRLTNTGEDVADIAWDWSPDGRMLALVVQEGEGNRDVYVINADGSGRVNLTGALESGSSNEFQPAWSPDGSMIAFAGERKSGSGVFIVNVDGSGMRQLYEGRGLVASPTWSPDGSRIAFSAQTEQGGVALYSVSLDGSEPIQLTSGAEFSESPAWAPMGGHIAYIGNREGAASVYVTDVEGRTDPVRLATVPLDRSDCCLGPPAWSPDGMQLAFAALHEGNWDVYVAQVDGSGVTRVTERPGDEISPAWSPDGSQLAFAASDKPAADGENAGTFEIFVVDSEGGEERQLTSGAMAAGGRISWAPD